MAANLYPDIITEDMYRKLMKSIMTGTREVYYGDKRVVYRSLDEMMRIAKIAANYLGITEETDLRTYGVFDSGIHRSGSCGSFDRD